MNWYFNINYFYKNKSWDIDQVKLAVDLSVITAEQYKEITSEDYTK